MLAAKALYAELKGRREVGPASGSYWESNFGRPTRRAIRAKAETVEVWTAGFSTGQFANMLAEVGCKTEFAGDR